MIFTGAVIPVLLVLYEGLEYTNSSAVHVAGEERHSYVLSKR